MKLGVSLYSFGGDLQTGAITTDEAIRYCAQIGAQGIELVAEQHLPNWPYTSTAELDHIKKLCKENSLEILCFSIYVNSMNRWDREATEEEYVEMIRRGAATAKYLGTGLFRPAYYGVPVDNLISLVKKCLTILEEYRVIWGVELHAPFPPAYYTEALEKVDSPWFRLIPDFSCWQTAGAAGHFQANPVETLDPLLKWTVHFHAKGHVIDENGEQPNTPYKAIFERMKEGGYKGSVVVENEGWIFNYKPCKDVVKKHFELIERYGA